MMLPLIPLGFSKYNKNNFVLILETFFILILILTNFYFH